MFSLLSCESGWLALCASMSCERRRAQAMPAGPPPTMTTSASIWGRVTFGSGLRKMSINTQPSGIQPQQFSAAAAPECPDRDRYFGRTGVDFTVAGNSREAISGSVAVDTVFSAITNQNAAVGLQMPRQVRELHFQPKRPR